MTLIFLVLLGLFLLFLELFVVPGVTFVGIAGALFLGAAIYFIFDLYGSSYGILSLILTSILSAAVIYRSVKTRFWKKFSLNQAIDAKVNEIENIEALIGQQGKALSALRPSGKALINGQLLEVQVADGFVDAASVIEVVSVNDKKVYVKPINK